MNQYCILILFLLFSNSYQNCQFIYQIFLSSFKDSDGDGIGDLKGVISKVQHILDIGADCLSLTPFFASGNVDSGYDIIDYMEIDPKYGNIENIEELITELDRKGIKLIIDLVINHSSDQHKWFQQSINKIEPYTDYYVWRNPKGYDRDEKPIPPTNWLTVFNKCAWTWNEKRKQFYYHQFNTNQPDLNLTNILVQKEFKRIIQFWVDKGVGGIRVDAARHLAEDLKFRDEPLLDRTKTELKYDDLDHIYTANRPETFEILRKIQDFTLSYISNEKMEDVIFLCEVSEATEVQLRKYFYESTFPYNFNFIQIRNRWFNAEQFREIIDKWTKRLPKGAVPNWMIENPDVPRVSNYFCEEYSQIYIMMIMTLPGTAIIYYGQEIGMKGFNGPNFLFDIRERLPMQWDDSKNAGFSTNDTLLAPVNPDYWRINLKSQKNNRFSHYSMFKKLSTLRHTSTAKHGSTKTYAISTWVLAIVREGWLRTHITVINWGTNTEKVNLHAAIKKITSKLTVEVTTFNLNLETKYKIDPTSTFEMKPVSGVVLSMMTRRRFYY